MMLAALFGKNYQRQRLLQRSKSEVMKEYLGEPFPDKKELVINSDIISVDFETTGLDFEKDSIVSIGMVNIVNLGVDLASSSHQVILLGNALSEESVVIHGITDNDCDNGVAITDALPALLTRLKGKVLLAHNARIELGFLNKVCRSLYDTDFIIPVIDTQHLAKRSLERTNKAYKSNDLRLFNLREKFNMPAYKAHNAQMDAVSTAELFLAIAGMLAPNNDLRLCDCLS